MSEVKACSTVNVITTCPPAGSQILLFNVSTEASGMALMDISVFKCCLLYQMFGAGIVTITGNDLVLGIYQNTNLVGNLLVYAWGIPNLLIPGSQWDYVYNDTGVVVGIEIFIGYGASDMFTIIPNPSCAGTPSGAFPEGINETEEFRGVATGRVIWDERRRSKYGRSGSFEVYMDDGTGRYVLTTIQGFPDNIDSPSYYDFDFGGTSNVNIIIT